MIFKTKNPPELQSMVLTIEMSEKERGEFTTQFHKQELLIKHDGKEYKVKRLHPLDKQNPNTVRVTVQ